MSISKDLWEEWDSSIVPLFPSGRHFHRFSFSLAFSISDHLTVGLHLCSKVELLVSLDDPEGMPQTLVLDDRCVTDTLILV